MTCETCRDLTTAYNVAVANGLMYRAGRTARQLMAHERSHLPPSKPPCCPGIPTTNLGRDLIEAWMDHDLPWHGNVFLKREADGSYTRLDPTTVTVIPREGYQGGTYSMHEDS